MKNTSLLLVALSVVGVAASISAFVGRPGVGLGGVGRPGVGYARHEAREERREEREERREQGAGVRPQQVATAGAKAA